MVLLAAAAWLLIAGESGWVSAELADAWFGPVAKGGAAMLVLGIAAAMLAPVGRELRRGHCVRCGAATERGQSYCLDHMRESVNEAQDRIRSEGGRHGRS